MVQSFSPFFNELGNGTFARGGLQELDLVISGEKKGGDHMLRFYGFLFVALGVQQLLVDGDGYLQVSNGNSKMFNVFHGAK